MKARLENKDWGYHQAPWNVWLRLAALLLVLICATVLISRSFLGTDPHPDMPWNEEFRLWEEGDSEDTRTSGRRVQIGKALRYVADAEEQGQPRGHVSLLVYPDGIVKGVWNGEFVTDKGRRLTVMAASYQGNTDASKVSLTGEGKPGKALYFITKGTYVVIEARPNEGAGHHRAGYIYVRGWLHPDLTATGEVVLTADKRSCEIYTWGARPMN